MRYFHYFILFGWLSLLPLNAEELTITPSPEPTTNKEETTLEVPSINELNIEESTSPALPLSNSTDEEQPILTTTTSPQIEESNPLDPSIRELIQKVQEAPDEEKRVLMNQLKTQLKMMNQANRKEAMIRLKNSFNKEGTVVAKSQSIPTQESIQTCNHQPKFRHLQQGIRGGNGLHQAQTGNNGQQGAGLP